MDDGTAVRAAGVDAPTSGARLAGWEDATVAGADGVPLHVVTTGAGAPVVLLHGFPDFWWAWRRQMPALAAGGFRAVAPDLRGYNLSGRPPRVEDYRVDRLADDVAAIVAAMAGGRAHVVGHDWGGVIAWHLAARHPDVVDRLVVLNAPHPARWRELLRSTTQGARSWYAAFFQLPWLPEALLGASGRRLLHRTWDAMHLAPGAFTAADHAVYDAAFATPGAIRAAVHYYRALARHGARVPGDRRVLPQRTLLVWGERDPALVAANAEGLERWVPRLTVRRVPEAGHWVMADAPAAVNAALLDFLRAP